MAQEFNQGKVFMHVRAMDVAILISEMSEALGGHFKLRGNFVTLGYMGKPIITPVDMITIYIDIKTWYRDWVEIKREKLTQPRKEPGLPC